MNTWEIVAITVPAAVIFVIILFVVIEVGVLRWGWMEKFEAFMDWVEVVGRKVARRP
ncbi:MAG TPA: hypothetical protein VIJ31_10580 [Acidothermaceae bacterium]